MRKIIENTLAESLKILSEFVADKSNIDAVERAAETMSASLKSGGKIIACGNGGSLCDATHFAEELTSRFRKSRNPIPAIAVNDAAYLTCTVNDYSPDVVFSRYVDGLGKRGDVLLAISTSGNSANVIEAAKTAKSKGIAVVALTGKGGGALAKIADIEIRAPKSDYSDRAQEIHIKIIHILVQCIEASMQP
jgi:phosphoheptose isomerase